MHGSAPPAFGLRGSTSAIDRAKVMRWQMTWQNHLQNRHEDVSCTGFKSLSTILFGVGDEGPLLDRVNI
uniref:Uncharacterized protein n=1 Tax=Arundo donax TaxID=35708 RepID=A0A0A9BHJ2_ARUDO